MTPEDKLIDRLIHKHAGAYHPGLESKILAWDCKQVVKEALERQRRGCRDEYRKVASTHFTYSPTLADAILNAPPAGEDDELHR